MSVSWFIDIELSRFWLSSLLKQISVVWYSQLKGPFLESLGVRKHSRESSTEISIVLICLSVTKQTGLVGSLGPPFFSILWGFDLNIWFQALKVIGDFPETGRYIDQGRHETYWVFARWIVILTFESVDEIVWCYHSNETSSEDLLRSTIYILRFAIVVYFLIFFSLIRIGIRLISKIVVH